MFSTGEDVNILILDTEEYSNTGGQKVCLWEEGRPESALGGGGQQARVGVWEGRVTGQPYI